MLQTLSFIKNWVFAARAQANAPTIGQNPAASGCFSLWFIHNRRKGSETVSDETVKCLRHRLCCTHLHLSESQSRNAKMSGARLWHKQVTTEQKALTAASCGPQHRSDWLICPLTENGFRSLTCKLDAVAHRDARRHIQADTSDG